MEEVVFGLGGGPQGLGRWGVVFQAEVTALQWVQDKKVFSSPAHGVSSLHLKDRDERKPISPPCIVFAGYTFCDPQNDDIGDYCLSSNYLPVTV